DLALAGGDDERPVRRLDRGDTLELGRTGDLAAPLRLRRDAGGRTTDVERPQRQLRARLADRLRGQDTDRLADVDHLHRREVAAVALLAQPATALAGEDRTDLHRRNPRVLDDVGAILVDQLAGLDQQLAVDRIDDIFQRHQTDDP